MNMIGEKMIKNNSRLSDSLSLIFRQKIKTASIKTMAIMSYEFVRETLQR